MKQLITNSIVGITLIAVLGLYVIEFRTKPVVYVDSAVILAGYDGMITARAELEEKTMAWQANIDTLTGDVQKAIMNYEKEVQQLTSKEKELSKELIKAKQDQLVNYQRAIQDKYRQEDEKLTSIVITNINSFLKEYGQKQGYEIILAATEYGNIAYAEEKLDITEEVLEGLNKAYSGE